MQDVTENKDVLARRSNSTRLPRVLLVDDDPLFGKLMTKVAEKQRIRLDYFSSVREAYKIVPLMHYDAGIMDYDLGRITGLQLCRFLEGQMHPFPLVMVSNYGLIEEWRWPKWVKKSISKTAGPYSILLSAIVQYEANKKK